MGLALDQVCDRESLSLYGSSKSIPAWIGSGDCDPIIIEPFLSTYIFKVKMKRSKFSFSIFPSIIW